MSRALTSNPFTSILPVHLVYASLVKYSSLQKWPKFRTRTVARRGRSCQMSGVVKPSLSSTRTNASAGNPKTPITPINPLWKSAKLKDSDTTESSCLKTKMPALCFPHTDRATTSMPRLCSIHGENAKASHKMWIATSPTVSHTATNTFLPSTTGSSVRCVTISARSSSARWSSPTERRGATSGNRSGSSRRNSSRRARAAKCAFPSKVAVTAQLANRSATVTLPSSASASTFPDGANKLNNSTTLPPAACSDTTCAGHLPPSSCREQSALKATRTCTTPKLPCIAAVCKTAEPAASCTLGSAPASRSAVHPGASSRLTARTSRRCRCSPVSASQQRGKCVASERINAATA